MHLTMQTPMMKYPFEEEFATIVENTEPYITAVFSSLVSDFITMPKGDGFIEYPVFERGYEALKKATDVFTALTLETVLPVVYSEPISIIVLRSILGFTPPEWAYVTTAETGIEISQGFARSLDRKVRMNPDKPLPEKGVTIERLKALVVAACSTINKGPVGHNKETVHRLYKADTMHGNKSVRNLADFGAPYPILLYERFLGRPFAGHRDSVSDLIGDSLEVAIEEKLHNAHISYRKTKRAEKIEGFDQTPDFIIPNEFNPQVVIEAKITEDDGTARDKATRIQHLGHLSIGDVSPDTPKYEVIACIGGRGFAVRRSDMKKMILATRGKIFTLKTLDRMIECTKLSKFVSKK